MVCDWPCVETWRESCCRKPWTSLVRFLMDTLFASQTSINPVSKEWEGSAWVGGGDGGCGGSGVELQRSVGTGAGLTGNVLRDERPMASSGTDGSTKEKFCRSESPIREQRQQELGHHRSHDHSVDCGTVLIARHLQEPLVLLQAPFEAHVVFSVGRDVVKGLETTEPWSGTWDACDVNGAQRRSFRDEQRAREVGAMVNQHCQQGTLTMSVPSEMR